MTWKPKHSRRVACIALFFALLYGWFPVNFNQAGGLNGPIKNVTLIGGMQHFSWLAIIHSQGEYEFRFKPWSVSMFCAMASPWLASYCVLSLLREKRPPIMTDDSNA